MVTPEGTTQTELPAPNASRILRLPLGSGLGAIRAPSLQGDANEAAFRKDAASGGILGEILSMYPTQTEAINARKSAQGGILQAIKNLTSGTGSRLSGGLNIVSQSRSKQGKKE